jgi:hypothetical protein
VWSVNGVSVPGGNLLEYLASAASAGLDQFRITPDRSSITWRAGLRAAFGSALFVLPLGRCSEGCCK